MAKTVIFLTSGTAWTVPANWNNHDNKVEVIGGSSSGGTNGNKGGGGGGYGKKNNLTLTPRSSVSYQIGQGGVGQGNTNYSLGELGTHTWFQANNYLVGYAANYDIGGSGVGDVVYTGGNGGPASGNNTIAGGGGAAAGPNGNGANGGNPAGGVATGGEWTSIPGGVTAGAGSGGAGGTSNGQHGGQGGAYGAGSGGSCGQVSSTAGQQGIIVISYTPLDYSGGMI